MLLFAIGNASVSTASPRTATSSWCSRCGSPPSRSCSWCVTVPACAGSRSTLCALAFATLAGPLGAYGVSRRSQTARLRVLLERSGLLVRGAIVPAGAAAPFEVRRQLSAVIAYLLDAHGPAPVRCVLGGAMPALTARRRCAGRRTRARARTRGR
jgi:hypothetical protein